MITAFTAIDVAFVSGLAAIVGASSGLLSAISVFWLAPGQEKHERELARRNRIHDALSSAYADYLYYIYELQSLVRRTKPRPSEPVPHGPPADVLDRLHELETDWHRAAARASIIASEGVAESMEDVDARFLEFIGRLGEVEVTPEAQRPADALKDEREAVDASVAVLEKRMRADTRN
jgi:hypothetical protein